MTTQELDDGTPRHTRFPIVGLGASAGGLAALEEFFSHMPAARGLGFVVVTHQHAGHTSMLAELLARKTTMPILQVQAPTRIEPDHIYTVVPGYQLDIADGVLRPSPIDPRSSVPMPVDHFFRSLAGDQKELAVGIVLSGTGSDGALGVKEIKGELGMVMAQDERSAEYGGMPHAAIATGAVDYVLPVDRMPEQLVAYIEKIGGDHGSLLLVPAAPGAAEQIFALVCAQTGHDFSQYKPSTTGRRIERRMNVHHLDTVERYLVHLRSNPAEVQLLFNELLIGVTSFFRDPEAWTALGQAVVQLLREKPDDHVLRVWIAGCSTGEEAYSLAILLREAMHELGRTWTVQLFATDLDPAAIDAARSGVYPLGIASDVSKERLARYFIQDEATYRVRKELRDMLVFATQNLIADPPFTKLDLLSCRNLLIYLDNGLQRRLLPLFHYSLRADGILFLGSSESVGSSGELFVTVDKKWKIFRRRETAQRIAAEFPAKPLPLAMGEITTRVHGREPAQSFDQHVRRVLVDELVPPTVIVHERGEVVHVQGRTGLFLEPAQGSLPNANIFNMAREGLQVALTTCLRKASTTSEEAVERGVQVRTNGDHVTVDVRVKRITAPGPLLGLLRVTFERARPVADEQRPVATGSPDRVDDLERELRYAQETHQTTIEELETSNEELKSTNEELQSTNEELQSTNEELETSKEELQSLNEELHTVNAELHGKVEALSRANNDMKNLLNSTDIATVFLDGDLRINRFTEQARRVLPLIPSDIGRPIADLVSTLRYDRLVEDAEEVLRTLVFKEREVRGQQDEFYLMRILPYRTTENVIEGLVLTFVDITKVKALHEEAARLALALHDAPVGVIGQDTDLRITWVLGSLIGRGPGELMGKTDEQIFDRREVAPLVQAKRRVLETGVPARLRMDLGVAGQRLPFDFYLEPRRDPSGAVAGLSCVAVDLTPPQ